MTREIGHITFQHSMVWAITS